MSGLDGAFLDDWSDIREVAPRVWYPFEHRTFIPDGDDGSGTGYCITVTESDFQSPVRATDLRLRFDVSVAGPAVTIQDNVHDRMMRSVEQFSLLDWQAGKYARTAKDFMRDSTPAPEPLPGPLATAPWYTKWWLWACVAAIGLVGWGVTAWRKRSRRGAAGRRA